jgi:hypothetical protein
MQKKTIFAMFVALAWYAAIGTAQSQAVNPQTSDQSATSSASPAAGSAAEQMVPAQAVLAQDIDSRSARPGEPFKATLSSTIHLKNGVELPRGTALVGTVATGNAPEGAKALLALRFTQADLKSGKTIPIEATIVGVAPPNDNLSVSSSGQAPPDEWDGKSLQVDVTGVLSGGIDLHSAIAGENSGVFVSTKKDDMKLKARTQIALAIGGQGTSATAGGF